MNMTEHLCTQNIAVENLINLVLFTTILFELLSLNLFSYSNNLINLFKDIGLSVVAAHIRPVFLESQEIHLTILANKYLVRHFERYLPLTLQREKQNTEYLLKWTL